MARIDGVISVTGKLGEVVGYKGRYGRTYMRKRKYTIKNPKSYGQAIQRMVLATVGKTSSWLKGVVDNSFDGYANGGESLNRFRKVNMQLCRAAAIAGTQAGTPSLAGDFVPKNGEGCGMWQGMQISSGSVPFAQNSIDFASNVFDLKIPITSSGDTVSATRAAFLAAMEGMGAQQGDQLTFCIIYKTESNETRGDFGRLIWVGLPEGDTLTLSTNGVLNSEIFKTENMSSSVSTGNTLEVYPTVSSTEMDETYESGVILTRVINGEQKHSTCFMTVTSEGTSINDASSVIPTYQGGASPETPQTDSPWYTENAENPQ